MGEAYFKRCERELRRRWQGERAVHLGEEGADGYNGWLRWELKCRKHLPIWIYFALAQARIGMKPNELSVAVLKEKGGTWKEALVVMRLEDFEDWFGGCSQSAHQKMMLEMAKEESKQVSAPPCYDEAYWEAMEEMAKEESDVDSR